MKTDYVYSDNRRTAPLKSAYKYMDDAGEIASRHLVRAPRDKRRCEKIRDKMKSVYWTD